MAKVEEDKFRAYAASSIKVAAMLLKLDLPTVHTSLAIMHRFYFRKSIYSCEPHSTIVACLFLASKIEER